ncbi:hypothetical protein LguiB_018974 [Lonicera macranthoides]
MAAINTINSQQSAAKLMGTLRIWPSLYHVRSESFPSTSHPTILRVEEELNKIPSWEATATPTAETIFISLSSLEDLYKSIDELFNLPHTQQALSHHQREK